MEVIFLGLVFLFDRLSLRNSVRQPKPLEVSSVHHRDAMRLSIKNKMSFVLCTKIVPYFPDVRAKFLF